jgi:hypothetical protein
MTLHISRRVQHSYDSDSATNFCVEDEVSGVAEPKIVAPDVVDTAAHAGHGRESRKAMLK